MRAEAAFDKLRSFKIKNGGSEDDVIESADDFNEDDIDVPEDPVSMPYMGHTLEFPRKDN